MYLNEIEEIFSDIEIFKDMMSCFYNTFNLYSELMNDILKQGTCGWNDLCHSIDKEVNSQVIVIVEKIKLSEIKTVELTKKIYMFDDL